MKTLDKWRLIDTGVATAQYNMAVDEALLSNFKEGDLPIFRLYRWEKSLSLGRFSKLTLNLDLETLQKQKLPFVRRMTGGGILVHGKDISYSLILPSKNFKNISVKESYFYLCQFLLTFYKDLGLNAAFVNELNLKITKSDICMSANEAYDIVLDGKKIGGNAQRYTKNILFQHGSIPLNFDNEIFKDIFLDKYTLIDIKTLDKTGKTETIEKLTQLLIESFKQSFKVDFIEDTLSLVELQIAQAFLKTKYSTSRWNIDAKT